MLTSRKSFPSTRLEHAAYDYVGQAPSAWLRHHLGMEDESDVSLPRAFGLPTPPASPKRPEQDLRARNNCSRSHVETPPSSPTLVKWKGDSGGLSDSFNCSSNMKLEGASAVPFHALRSSRARVISGGSENAPPSASISIEKRVQPRPSCPNQATGSFPSRERSSSDEGLDEIDWLRQTPEAFRQNVPPQKLISPCPTSAPHSLANSDVANLDGESSSQTLDDDESESDTISDGHGVPSKINFACLSSTANSTSNHRLRLGQSQRKFDCTASSSVSCLDRFIAPRIAQPLFRERLAITRPVASLTPQEKMMRRRTGLSDPFSPNMRGVQPPSDQRRNLQYRSPMQPSRTRATDLEVLALRSDPMINSHRQVSFGAAWNIGGSAVTNALDMGGFSAQRPSNGVDNNIPRFTSRFLEAMAPEADLDLHEKRLALALDIDLANRVLPIAAERAINATLALNNAIGGGSANFARTGRREDSLGRYVWKNNEWTREGSLRRNVQFLPLLNPRC